jgi:mannitol-1-phosphate 5-dehydrogenase
VAKTFSRLANPAIDDEIVRVGRDPLRKLSRFERLIGPAAYHAQMLGTPIALLALIESALRFVSDSDPEAQRLQLLLATLSAEEFVAQVCGLNHADALFKPLTDLVHLHKSSYSHQSQPS